jgi:hypothetical protein
MATTYEAIATVTVGSGGAATIEFTSIPSTYTDLCILVSARNTANNSGEEQGQVVLTFNSATTNFSGRALYGYGSGVGSLSSTSDQAIWGYITSAQATTNTFGNTQFYIPNYAGSSNKSVSVDSVNEHNGTDGRQNITAGLWSNTAAITTATLKTYDNNGSAVNFVQHSSATLYGIKNS